MADHEYLLHQDDREAAGVAAPAQRQAWFRTKLGKVLVATVTLACVAAVVAAVVVSTRSHSTTDNNNSNGDSSSSSGGAAFATSGPVYRSLRTAIPSMPEATLSAGSEPHLTRAQLSFTHVDPTGNGHTVLNFDVEHVSKLVNLARLTGIKDASARGLLLTVTFLTQSAASAAFPSFVVDAMVTASSEFTCGERVFRIASACSIAGNAISCRTEAKKFTDLIKTGTVSFTTDYTAPNSKPSLVQPPRKTSNKHYRGRRSLGSFLEGALGSIWSAVGGAGGVVEDLVTGSFSYSNNNLLASQWNVPLVSGNIDGIMQYTSSASISTSSNLQIQIQDYSLVQFTATVTGSGVVNADATLTANYQGSWTDGPNEVVQPTTLISTNLPIAGIDIPIALVGTVWMAAQAQTTDAASGYVAYQASGSFTGGINVDSNGPQWVATPSFQYGLNGNPSLSASASFQGAVQVSPVLVLNVGTLGNAQAMVPLQFNSNANANEALSDPSSSQCPDGTLAFDCELQIQVQANVNIEIDGISVYSQNWGPSTEFDQDYPFANACF